MTQNKLRDIATSLTTLIFLVIGTTGVLMYFHLFDSYTKDLHETLGLVFVAVVFFHVFFNWNSMKKYFSKKVFLLSSIVILTVSLGFVLSASGGENPKKTIIVSVLKAPIEDAVNILGQDMDTLQIKLQKAGLKLQDETSLKELAKNNKISPFEIVKIITNK